MRYVKAVGKLIIAGASAGVLLLSAYGAATAAADPADPVGSVLVR